MNNLSKLNVNLVDESPSNLLSALTYSIELGPGADRHLNKVQAISERVAQPLIRLEGELKELVGSRDHLLKLFAATLFELAKIMLKIFLVVESFVPCPRRDGHFK